MLDKVSAPANNGYFEERAVWAELVNRSHRNHRHTELQKMYPDILISL